MMMMMMSVVRYWFGMVTIMMMSGFYYGKEGKIGWCGTHGGTKKHDVIIYRGVIIIITEVIIFLIRQRQGAARTIVQVLATLVYLLSMTNVMDGQQFFWYLITKHHLDIFLFGQL